MSEHKPLTEEELAIMAAQREGSIPRERTSSPRTGLDVPGADLVYTCSLRDSLLRAVKEIRWQRAEVERLKADLDDEFLVSTATQRSAINDPPIPE